MTKQNHQFRSEILNCRILIVEDDFLNRTVLREVFKKEGFHNIEEAENGKEGFVKLEKFLPQLVISDVKMPEMDGFELCQKIRQHKNPKIARVPILIQTALKKSEDRDKVFKVGASDYIAKPLDHNEVLARSIIHIEREIVLRRLYNFNSGKMDLKADAEEDFWSFKRLSNTINVLLDEIEQSQYELQQAKEKAEKADRFKTEFLAYAAHELKTPLHCIVNFAQMGMIDSESGNLEAVKEHINDIFKNSKRLNALVSDLIDVSMMETGHVDVSLKHCDVEQVVKNAVYFTAGVAKEREITVEVEPLDKPVNVLVDQRRIEQVFVNLISNAVRFSPDGGKIKWKFKHAIMSIPETNLSLPAISISIEDEGPGIPEAELEHIFQPFVHDQSKISQGKSTGLGLTICRLILGLFHGTIYARNKEVGKGAVFEITLPLQNKIGV